MTYVNFLPRVRTETEKGNGKTDFNPAVDIIENEDLLKIMFDLPGFEKNEFSITVNEGVLVVSGERKPTESGDEKYFHYFERFGGKFSRSFRLAKYIDPDATKASYENGVLLLELSKKEEAKPRSIAIK